jgi:hypothetical protein
MATKASAVMQRWFQEVWSEGRPAAIRELFASHGLAHGLGPEPVRGPDAYLAFWNTWDFVSLLVGWARCPPT